jgi:CRP-like cAMP-binding protein
MPPPTANGLLAALPEAEYQRLAPNLEPFALPLGLALYESGTQLNHVYFQTDGIVSLLYVMENGSSGEIAVIGSEGVVGVSLFMGAELTTGRAVVQSSGHAYRLRAGYMMQEFERGGYLQHVLLRFTQALITQMAQTVVCNRHHSIDQQLCRWLLLSLDRLPGNQINMTQELIANMLGVRREGVTVAAGQLQSAGLISYRRGLITVLDRPTLQKRVCECYTVGKKETDRLLTLRVPSQPDPGLPQSELRPQRANPRNAIKKSRVMEAICPHASGRRSNSR